MLEKGTISKISKKGWQKYIDESSNPYQTKTRIRHQCELAIRDLIMLAKKLPNDEFKVIFNEQNLKSLVSSILATGYTESSFVIGLSILDSYRLQLSDTILGECIDFYKNQVKLFFADMPFTGQQIINQLENSQNICKEISYKVELDKQKESKDKDNLIYLFNWSKIPGRDENRLEFLTSLDSVSGILPTHYITSISKSNDDSHLSCSLESDITDEPVKVDLKIDEEKLFLTYHLSNHKQIEIPLILKYDGKMKYIYIQNKYYNANK